MMEETFGNFVDVAQYKLEQAKDDLDTAKLLLDAGKYKAANNRAYYSCYHAIDSVLALEPKTFKRHKDTLAYFNKNYVHSGVFPREVGRKLSRLEVIQHKSDYDSFYIASREEAIEQIDVASEVVALIEKYMKEKPSKGSYIV